MREIWVMQPRFDKRSGSTPFSMVAHIRFRAGFDFLRLRADVEDIAEGLVEWWQEFSITDDAQRHDMLAQVREELRQQQRAQQKKGQPVVHRVAAPASAAAHGDAPPPGAPALDGDAPAKKRRRRRRKTGGNGNGNGNGADAGAGSGDAA